MSSAWGEAWDILNSGNSSNSCSSGGCGTGDWSGPKPGDPDNNSVLQAVGVYGGVDVSWTFPTINPHAVSHVILYRGLSDVFPLAIKQGIVSGSFFFDRIEKQDIQQYFYWIVFVSVNGTYGAPIGPASATPLPTIGQIIEDLTGLIDDGVLAQELKEKIDRINALGLSLEGEVLNRIRENEDLTEVLDFVLERANRAVSYIEEETRLRLNANEGIINSINNIAVGLNNNAAAILEEKTVRVTNDEAMAEDIQTLYVEAADNSAAISNEQQVRAEQNQATTISINTLVATTGSLGAAVQTNATAITDTKSSFAQDLTTVQSVLGNQLTSVQTNLTTNINAIDGKLSGMYTAKVDVNGLVGGFGIANDGLSVEAAFDVDRFWIGRTTDKRKPFIIDNGAVYINTAMIADASIETAHIGTATITDAQIKDFIQSRGYVPGNAGWRIDKDGSVEFGSGKFRGDIHAESGYFSGIVSADSVRAALSNSTNFVYSTPGNYGLVVPTGLDADKVRIRLIGGSGGGGGGGSGSLIGLDGTHAVGGNGGAGNAGAISDYIVSYASLEGQYVAVTVGAPGYGGAGGPEYFLNQNTNDFNGGAGGSGGASSVSTVGASAGGAGGGFGYAATNQNRMTMTQGANGWSGSGGGTGGIGGGQAGVAGVLASHYSGTIGSSGLSGTGGYVLISCYRGDILVKNDAYQALLTWLDSRGIGTVPVGAR